MANKFTYNPLTGNLDITDDEVHQVASASTTTNQDLEVIADGSANGVIYFWVNGHRYYLTGTVDDPTSGGYVGANAALSLLGP